MNDASRFQGWAICIGAAALALIFLIGLLGGHYWALAVPVAILTLFVLALTGWVGFTIATIRVEPDPAPEVLSTDSPAPVTESETPTGDAT
ncbi:MAG: hypothetical protein JRG92_12255 [Deltaproteobacteria bacterium]|jgi:hypothetical protein|nr:hypothetical protein [Deltaproteobacteria bacterium]MBW2384403.1 hypothetical protein [Deltaproteobacteria bacterium]MBW2695303.1 hypothetical protein [Deltaproteobacteria bacterium]